MSIVNRVRRPIRSESHPTIGEPKKMPTSVDAAMSPLHTGRQTEVRRDQRQDHGDDAEVEAVESLADRRRRGHPPQHAHVAPRHEARH